METSNAAHQGFIRLHFESIDVSCDTAGLPDKPLPRAKVVPKYNWRNKKLVVSKPDSLEPATKPPGNFGSITKLRSNKVESLAVGKLTSPFGRIKSAQSL